MMSLCRSKRSSLSGGSSKSLTLAPACARRRAACSRLACVAASASPQRGVRHRPILGFDLPESKSAAGLPLRISSEKARSSTPRAKMPIVSRDSATNLVPARLMLPKLGLIAKLPQ